MTLHEFIDKLLDIWATEGGDIEVVTFWENEAQTPTIGVGPDYHGVRRVSVD
jgi:hypothetical protein